LVLVVLTGLLVAPGNAQSIYTGQQASPPLHVLTGTVVNSATGAPIPFALVQVEQNAKLTDQNGNFRFENLVSASVNIQAHKPGFFEEQEISQMHRPTMVTLSDHPTDTVVPLIPEAVIVGHAEDSEGEPLGNLPVRVRYGQLMNGRRSWQQQGFRQTDEDGNFRLANLKPGTYYVQVGPDFRGFAMREQLSSKRKAEAIPAEYYPGVRDMSDATPLRITAGQHVNVDFEMKRVPAFHLSGIVTGVTTNFGNLTLLEQDGENLNLGIRFDGRTGRFDAFPVPAGSYRLHFNGRDSDGQQLFADAPINVNGDIPELRVSVQRTLNIPVEIETEYTKQNSGQSQGFASGGPSSVGNPRPSFPGQIHLLSRSFSNQQFSMNRAGEDGTFISGVEPGTYDVEMDLNGTSYVASATCGGINLLTDPIVVVPGGDPQPIHIVLRDDGASLNGAVQIADTNQSALVLMVPEGSSANPPRQVYVDSSGSFHAQGIAPGSYDILAFDRLDGLEYRNREVLNAYLSRAAHVTLSADEQARVTVDLIQTKQ
jgi:hypothetical protein